MGDLIRRQDVIDALVETEDIKGLAYKQLEDRLEKIPAVAIERDCDRCFGACFGDCSDCEPVIVPESDSRADRPQGWIPCSERLPDENGEYLVTQKNGSIGIYVFNYDGNSEEYFKRCATAWMPLPKPWKGTDDE